MDIFKGRITSSGFESGDRIVVGIWNKSPFGKFSDIMWSNAEGKNILIAPTKEIGDYISSMYSFDEILISNIELIETEDRFEIITDYICCNFSWSRGFRIPFRRPLWFISTIENLFAKLIFGTKTSGVTNDKKREWYCINKISKVKIASASLSGKSFGQKTKFHPKAKFGFSEPPKKPTSVLVTTIIKP